MAKSHPGLPKGIARTEYKGKLLDQLIEVDLDQASSQRARSMELAFKSRISSHVGSLPSNDAEFKKFFTSPYVLMIHAMKNGYTKISQIEHDILPAKLFSSMETSAGRAIEDVALPAYGWSNVRSEMHTANSALDGKALDGDTLRAVTLKSGPRCLNDEMSENFADAILSNAEAWAEDAGVRKIEFTYGVLYGTEKQSNKKDWHILRKLYEKHGEENFSVMPTKHWHCVFVKNGVEIETTVRIGIDWWQHLGGRLCLTEIAVAIIRACVPPGEIDPPDQEYVIKDLSDIVSLDCVPEDFNPSILQRSQLPWFFFFMRHFYDDIIPGWER